LGKGARFVQHLKGCFQKKKLKPETLKTKKLREGEEKDDSIDRPQEKSLSALEGGKLLSPRKKNDPDT